MDSQGDESSGRCHRATGRVLRRCIDGFFGQTGLLSHRVFGCWKQWVGVELTPASVVQVAEVDDPYLGPWRVADVVRDLRFPRPRQLTPADALVRDLLLAVMLSISERLVALQAPGPGHGKSTVDVPMSELLTAAVVAGAWLDVPLEIRYDASRKAAHPVNVIDDFTPLEVETETGSPLGVMHQELQQFLARHFAQSEVRTGMSVQSLLAGLQQLRSKHGIVPMVGIANGERSHPLSDKARQEAFASRFGVPVFTYGTLDMPAEMKHLESDLLNHLQGSLRSLFHTHSQEEDAVSRPRVFISYAHEDEPWRELLRQSLRSLERKQQLEIWDDRQLRTGDLWRRKIDEALASCGIAVLLVSREFLNSDFINDVELVKIFARHEKDGLWIYPILIGQCDWQGEDWLAERQMKLCNGQPFKKGSEADRDDGLAEIAREFRERLQPGKN